MRLIDTFQFAKLNGVQPESVRSRLSRFGSWHGIKPIKRAGNQAARLLWPALIATADGPIDPTDIDPRTA